VNEINDVVSRPMMHRKELGKNDVVRIAGQCYLSNSSVVYTPAKVTFQMRGTNNSLSHSNDSSLSIHDLMMCCIVVVSRQTQ